MTCAAACGATALLVAVPAAPAADADPWLAGLARGLRDDPVHVSDSVSRAVSAAELSELRAAVRAMPFETRVAIVSGEPRNEDVLGPYLFDVPELLAGALDAPGLYVVADATFDSVHTTAVGVRPLADSGTISHALALDVADEARLAAQVRYALRLAATGKRERPGVAAAELEAKVGRRDRDDTENLVSIVGAGVGGVAGFAGAGVLWWRRRPRPWSEQPELAVREPAEDVPVRATDAVARLSAALAAADEPPDAAFDFYSAASKVQREAHTPVDSVGALVLAQDGLAVLSGKTPRRRCFFHPGHRGATTATRWRLGSEEAEVPACARCARALRAGRTPHVLGDRGRPYYEHDTVWARTGFGAVDDEFAERVLAGR